MAQSPRKKLAGMPMGREGGKKGERGKGSLTHQVFRGVSRGLTVYVQKNKNKVHKICFSFINCVPFVTFSAFRRSVRAAIIGNAFYRKTTAVAEGDALSRMPGTSYL